MLKRKNVVKMLGIGSLCLFFLGCADESFLVQEGSSTVILEEEVILSENKEEELNILQKNDNTESGYGLNENTELSEQEQRSDKAGASGNSDEVTEIAVHVCGAVNQPGVYYFKSDQRIYEGIQKAGGFREDADPDYLNQALLLEDGMKITVPTKEETQRIKNSENIAFQTGESSEENGAEFIQTEEYFAGNDEMFVQKGSLQEKNETQEADKKVDLNTADEALLCTLPGIGESRAKSIISYRKDHGPFEKTEDVMKVSGIKEAAFEKIKDFVMVSKE